MKTSASADASSLPRLRGDKAKARRLFAQCIRTEVRHFDEYVAA